MTVDAIILEQLQSDILIRQIEGFLAALPEDGSRAPYIALREAVSRLEVPGELADQLGAVIEVLLSSGRVRKTYGPGAELALWALFQKTPRGRTLIESTAGINEALKPLMGRSLEFINVTARAPGVYSLSLKAAGISVVLRFEPAGVRVESLEIGAD